jgi:hypothetical protein
MRSPFFIPVPWKIQWFGLSQVQSAKPTPYEVEPINFGSSRNPPARRMIRLGRPSLLAESVTRPETLLPLKNARLTPPSRAPTCPP